MSHPLSPLRTLQSPVALIVPAAYILVLQLTMYSEFESLSACALLGSLLASVGFSAILAVAQVRKWSQAIAACVFFLWGLTCLAATLYANCFKCIPTVHALSLIPQLPSLLPHIGTLCRIDHCAAIVGLAVTSWLFCYRSRPELHPRTRLLLLPVGVMALVALPITHVLRGLRAGERDRRATVFTYCPLVAVHHYGYLSYLWLNWHASRGASVDYTNPLANPLPPRRKDTLGAQAAHTPNILLIQVESLETATLDMRAGG